MGFITRLKHGWDAFVSNKDPTILYKDLGVSYSTRPDRIRFTRGNERTTITSVLNRIAVDAAAIPIKHVKLDEDGRYLETINSPLNNCLSIEANKDQTGRAFIQDIVQSFLDEGCVAVVPTHSNVDIRIIGEFQSFQVGTMRTGKIMKWFPDYVTVRLYNDITGIYQEMTFPKSNVAIIENPFYAVMNEPSSTLQRLNRKLAISDILDENSASNKLDLIIQLPYVVKGEVRKRQAEETRKGIEMQLATSTYGIAWIDSTQKITQLNRSIENNLQPTIDKLTEQLYSQLGITQGILDGTANDETMQNYMNRTIEPILSAITDEFKRKFLSKTARSQLQSIKFFQDPFKLVPVSQMAEIADKFTRNEIMTSNEIRQAIGMIPSTDPSADELRNKNLSAPKESDKPQVNKEEIQNEETSKV